MLFFVQHYLFLPILWGRGYVIFPFFYAYNYNWELIVLGKTKFFWKVKIFAETSNILFCIWTRKTSLFHLDLNKPCMRVSAATSYSLMAILVVEFWGTKLVRFWPKNECLLRIVLNHVKLGISLRVPYCVVDAGYGLGRSLGDCKPALPKGRK